MPIGERLAPAGENSYDPHRDIELDFRVNILIGKDVITYKGNASPCQNRKSALIS